MEQGELWERIRQQVRMRRDAVRYRVGLGFREPTKPTGATLRPRFFFSGESVPGLVALLMQRLPQQANQIVHQAERICCHRFDLLGYEDLDYGASIDWSCDRVHNKRALGKPWFKIRYLDFQQVGDSKIIWELNRHQHFVTLAKAYRITGAEKFAAELFRQWRHWHAQNPYPIGINWASSLEVAFRSLSWIWSHQLLAGSPALPPNFHAEWLRALAVSGGHIESYLSTYFSPNTHLLGEGVALFFIGMMCPELQSAESWKKRGWEIVLQQSQRQVRSDGFHFEQSTYYHVYALDFFLHARILAGLNGTPVPAEFDHTLERMLNVLHVLGRAGAPPQLGDDDGGRLFDPRRNRTEHLLDPLATGAVLYGRGDFKSVARGLREETIWLLGEQGIADFDRLPEKPSTPASVALGASGFYVMADGRMRQLVVDAGPQGADTAGHGHADALSISLHSEGCTLLRDSGTMEYVGGRSRRNVFRNTAAHNTLVVDGASQSEPKGPFAWSSLPTVSAERWVSGQDFDLFIGSHDGYHRLPRPVTHRRWVFSLKSHFWLVRDLATGEGEHDLDLSWHLGPDLLSVDLANRGFLDSQGNGLFLLTPEGSGWLQRLEHTTWSPAYGRRQAARTLHFGTTTKLPAELATLLLASAPAQGLESGRLTKLEPRTPQDLISAYHYAEPEVDHSMIFADHGTMWNLGPWTSDSRFVYYGEEKNARRRTLIVCDGTEVAFHGQRILSSSAGQWHCELVCADQSIAISCSDANAMVEKEALERLWAEPIFPILTNTAGNPDRLAS